MKTIKERIQAKISISDSGCWNWTASKNKKGYGTIQVKRRSRLAHRESYEAYVEDIKPGNYVLHKCDNPSCVNPEHLFQGTQSDNMKDMFAKGRANVPKGESHMSAKLNEQQVLEILHDSGNQRDTAKRFGVSKGLIWAIKKGEAWSQLTGVHRATEAMRDKQ